MLHIAMRNGSRRAVQYIRGVCKELETDKNEVNKTI